MKTEPDLLRAYLDASGAACPKCRYDLRGTTDGRCPECGHALSLALHATGRSWRREGLLLLVLSWILLAGILNGARAGNAAWVAASTTSPPVQWASLFNGTFRSGTTTAMPLVLTVPARPTTPEPVTTAIESDFETTAELWPDLPGGVRVEYTVVSNPARPGLAVDARRNWSNVTMPQWIRLAAWTGFGLLGAAGLILFARVGPRAAAERVPLAPQAIAWAGFGSYIAYQTWIVARELV